MLRSAAIQNLAAIDIVGERVDGGVDLVIVASADLDASPQTLRSLETKLTNYVEEASSGSFRTKLGIQDGATITIIIRGDHFISEEAIAVVQRFIQPAAQHGVGIIIAMPSQQAG
jgi:hypothetical protein